MVLMRQTRSRGFHHNMVVVDHSFTKKWTKASRETGSSFGRNVSDVLMQWEHALQNSTFPVDRQGANTLFPVDGERANTLSEVTPAAGAAFHGSALLAAYGKLVAQLMHNPQGNLKFIIFNNNKAGLGNKIRGFGSALMVALKERRILLLGDSMLWLLQFYNGTMSMWTLDSARRAGLLEETSAEIMTSARKSEIPFAGWREFVSGTNAAAKFWSCTWGSMPHDFHRLAIWDGCFGIPARVGWNNTLRDHFIEKNPSVDMLLHVNTKGSEFTTKSMTSDSDKVYRNLYFLMMWQATPLLLQNPTQHFLRAALATKTSLQWSSYDIWIGFQLRVAVDGPPGWHMKPSTIRYNIACLRSYIQNSTKEFLSARKRRPVVAVLMATDAPSKISEVRRELTDIAAVVSCSKENSRFVQTKGGGNYNQMLQPMMELHLLGETSEMMTTGGSTFGFVAAARTGRRLHHGKSWGEAIMAHSTVCSTLVDRFWVEQSPMQPVDRCI
jgi:hypothetical protein